MPFLSLSVALLLSITLTQSFVLHAACKKSWKMQPKSALSNLPSLSVLQTRASSLRLLSAESPEDKDAENEGKEGGKVVEEEGFKIMGRTFSVKDPQDWITVFLTGVIAYNTIDIIGYYVKKFTGME